MFFAYAFRVEVLCIFEYLGTDLSEITIFEARHRVISAALNLDVDDFVSNLGAIFYSLAETHLARQILAHTQAQILRKIAI